MNSDNEEAIRFVVPVDPDSDSDESVDNELPAADSDCDAQVTHSLKLKTFVSNLHNFTGTIVGAPLKGAFVLCPSLHCVKEGHHVPLNRRSPMVKPDSKFQQTLRARFKVDPQADWVCRSCVN